MLRTGGPNEQEPNKEPPKRETRIKPSPPGVALSAQRPGRVLNAPRRRYNHPIGRIMDSKTIRQLRKIAGRDHVLDRPEELMLYEYDVGVDRSRPGALVCPRSTRPRSEDMGLARSTKTPVVTPAAGTGLSGGAIARKEAIMLAMSAL